MSVISTFFFFFFYMSKYLISLMLSVMMILVLTVSVVAAFILNGINLDSVLSMTAYLPLGFISPLLGLTLGDIT